MFKETFETESYGGDRGSSESAESLNEGFARAQILLAEEALKSQHLKIGEGQTAEVHTVALNENNCFKIISTMEHHGTVEITPELPRGPKFLPLKEEAEFLDALSGFHRDVRVPVPYFTVTRKTVREEAKSLDEGMISVLCMERLNAVSIRDVLRGGAELPEGFDLDDFFDKVADFIERMHGRGIHHRDLHDGNIMIDLETSQPVVIDFGCAVRAIGDDDREIYRNGSTIYIPDVQNLAKVKRLLVQHLTSLQ